MAYKEPGAGDLNRRLAIRERTDIPAADMGLDSTFSELKARWAKIEPVGTAIYSAGVQTDNKITHRITLRLIAGVTDRHELVHVTQASGELPGFVVVPNTPLYRVKRNADMNGRRRFTLIEVEEVTPSQSGGGIYG
ncbi:head-tail adaptor protein [Pseudomonas syringae group sp. J309-1]|uniref:head-tail adaptor protein n=1 Tax=Pseudomonas syringae group sp. J309-1 TaxID=3079588 RepID=UPI002913C494|nr:head-tail adaptor protein [Pseudomonas syringae group sp. J309-1]MDU8357985.1 head-tail adaptor protein [Pseudomonas syringae group sp. J309-1]